MNSPSAHPDRLYDLLPAIVRLRDAARGYPLQALLRVVDEQVDVVEHDIAGLYENWFIETCRDWVVPYIGALVGYQPIFDPAAPGSGARAQARERILIPRQEVANTIRFRRRKGTARALEEIAGAVAGWPARAVEFRRLLAVTQNIDFLHLDRGRTVDLRRGDALDRLGGPFDPFAHTIDVRRPDSNRAQGRYDIPSVGVFVWRLRAYSVTQSPAYCFEEQSPQSFLFSALGHDTPLFTKPQPTRDRSPGELDLPIPIRRRSFETQDRPGAGGATEPGVPFFYGPGKSLQIWTGPARDLVAAEAIVPADLSGWTYRPQPNTVAVDPVLGRIAFPPGQSPKGVWVSYEYGFSADIAGGEYPRTLSQPPGATVYLVGTGQQLAGIGDALTQWRADQPEHAVIEIVDSGVYVEPIDIVLAAHQTLQIRAANGARPVLRMLDWKASGVDGLNVSGEAPSWLTLDGLTITGRGVLVEGQVTGITLRHCTLVPGWGLACDCRPLRPTEPSLSLSDGPDCLTIEHSIVGAIEIDRNEVKRDPLLVRIRDSIVDATSSDSVAIGAAAKQCAHASLDIRRCTVFGQVQTRTLELAENTLFNGVLRVCRRQQGCVRYCYVTPSSRTPPRYECQPDLVQAAARAQAVRDGLAPPDRDAMVERETLRVEPQFDSTRYGHATYARLSAGGAAEICRGADDESEMGVFHDLFQPQRADNLGRRLAAYTPASLDVGVFFAT
jgi:hypothetical protein